MAALEIRTVAGPSRQVQWVLRGGPHTSGRMCDSPCGVSAAVTEAGVMPDEHLPETVSVGAVRDPPFRRGLHQIADRGHEHRLPNVAIS